MLESIVSYIRKNKIESKEINVSDCNEETNINNKNESNFTKKIKGKYEDILKLIDACFDKNELANARFKILAKNIFDEITPLLDGHDEIIYKLITVEKVLVSIFKEISFIGFIIIVLLIIQWIF